jgi:hypothetical protein
LKRFLPRKSVLAPFFLLLASCLLAACFDTNRYSQVGNSANLTNLSISPGRLDQFFENRATSYTATEGFSVSSVRITPTAESTAAKITVNGTAVASGAASPPIPLDVGPNEIDINVVAEGGATTRTYTITITRQPEAAFVQDALIKASNPRALARFGYAISLSGDTLAVGSPFESSAATGIDGNQADTSAPQAGAVYVFVKSGGGWTQQAYIKASNAGAGQNFGWSVSLSGDTLAVGAPLESDPSPGSPCPTVDPSAHKPDTARSGAAYVFVRNPTTGKWSQQAYLKASDTGVCDDFHADDRFGWSVSLSGDTLAVGAPYESSAATGVGGDQGNNSAPLSGAVYVFTRTGIAWPQQAFIKASNTGAGDQFGASVVLDGDTLAVGAPFEDSRASGVDGDQTDNSATNSGAVYLFTRSGGLWSQQHYLKTTKPVLTGAQNASAFDPNTGYVTGDLVTFAGNLYRAVQDTPPPPAQAPYPTDTAYWIGVGFDQFGSSLALDGTTLVVGAPYDDGSTADGVTDPFTDYNSGAVYVFTNSGGTWSQQARIKADPANAGDHFGASVALSGDTLLIGAPLEDGAATGLIGDPTNKGARDSGAAYVFTRASGVWSQKTYVKASDTYTFAWFGNAVAMTNGTLVVSSVQQGSSASLLGHANSATGCSSQTTSTSAECLQSAADTEDGSGAVYLFSSIP